MKGITVDTVVAIDKFSIPCPICGHAFTPHHSLAHPHRQANHVTLLCCCYFEQGREIRQGFCRCEYFIDCIRDEA